MELWMKMFLLTGDELYREGRLSGPRLIGGDDPDGVDRAAAPRRQGAGAGGGVALEALVTHHMVPNGPGHVLIQFPGHQQLRQIITRLHGDIDGGRSRRSCSC